jgi:hypothetical protein
MMKIVKAIGIAGTLTSALLSVPWGAGADETNKALAEGQAVTVQLGADASVISYWISTPEGPEVVTTIDIVSGRDTDAEHHAIARFSTRLLPGQTQLVSVPVAVGQEQPVLSISRVGGRIEVARVARSSI